MHQGFSFINHLQSVNVWFKLFSFSIPPPSVISLVALKTPSARQIDTYSSSTPPSRAHLVFTMPFSIPQPALSSFKHHSQGKSFPFQSAEGCFQCLGMSTNPLLTPNSSNSYPPIFKLVSAIQKRSTFQMFCFKTSRNSGKVFLYRFFEIQFMSLDICVSSLL